MDLKNQTSPDYSPLPIKFYPLQKHLIKIIFVFTSLNWFFFRTHAFKRCYFFISFFSLPRSRESLTEMKSCKRKELKKKEKRKKPKEMHWALFKTVFSSIITFPQKSKRTEKDKKKKPEAYRNFQECNLELSCRDNWKDSSLLLVFRFFLFRKIQGKKIRALEIAQLSAWYYLKVKEKKLNS